MSKAIETLYEHGTVNEKRVDTDRLFTDTGAECAFTGILDKTIRFVEDFQLLDSDNWARFVNQFKVRTDSENNGWRGEYWGKMMRGAAFTYAYTRDEKLYKACVPESVPSFIVAIFRLSHAALAAEQQAGADPAGVGGDVLAVEQRHLQQPGSFSA